MKLGIVGLPNVGKSTLFNAITNAGAESANYPFCTIEPNVGVVAVPDARLDKLAEMYQPDKKTPAGHRVRGHRRSGEGRQPGRGPGQQVPGQHPRARTPSSMWCAALTTRTSSTWRAMPARRPVIRWATSSTIDLELIMADLEMVQPPGGEGDEGRQGRQEVPPRGRGVQGAGRPIWTAASPPAPLTATRTTRR